MGAQRNRLKVYPNMGPQRSSRKDHPNRRPPSLKCLLDIDSGHRQAHSSWDHDEALTLISYCSYIYTFNDPSESPSQHDHKRDKLINLLSIIKSWKKSVPLGILPPLFTMISVNIFRPLPPPNAACIHSNLPEDDDLVATPAAAWLHLQIVYDILSRLIISLEPKVLSEYIDHPFILRLLTLFQSEDPRERDFLKNVFHRIYSKFLSSRSFMRKAMSDVLLNYVFDTEQRHCGIGDLLEIWGTIINGFSFPLKEEHKFFLTRVLIPLHRPKGMQSFHKQLAYCVYQFVEKEPVLGVAVVKGILRYWPRTNCPKEVLLIGELEELVENMGLEQYKILALPLCKQITKCLNSWNSQVAERALYIWNNEQFVKMASEAIDDVLPILVKGIESNLRWHWNRNVRELTKNVKEMLEEMEPYLYSKCLSQIDRSTYEVEMRQIQRWKRVEMAANVNQIIKDSECRRGDVRRQEVRAIQNW
ncbi:serine/threonine protein phosphatase 2A 57 kDa regulatory subunit B' beta isoform [Dorcoceras hygrometricum]|uniref:Serine/threonine protein phosphatase 2A 57 kDa regulatory subunit B' beta isoform n=1 Tax=Dorcoceras hygrometricum TaxID=472368 RepID=A0A2Z7AGV9_9LAMI|nr:serine/threonine protein phosphatase 2A 57 kDa regulatory subunit B' beta isoform [Dorcoceras hygrometricum]